MTLARKLLLVALDNACQQIPEYHPFDFKFFNRKYHQECRDAFYRLDKREWKKSAYKGYCEYCFERAAIWELEIDHFIPILVAPELTLKKSNWRLACHVCNQEKRAASFGRFNFCRKIECLRRELDAGEQSEQRHWRIARHLNNVAAIRQELRHDEDSMQSTIAIFEENYRLIERIIGIHEKKQNAELPSFVMQPREFDPRYERTRAANKLGHPYFDGKSLAA